MRVSKVLECLAACIRSRWGRRASHVADVVACLAIAQDAAIQPMSFGQRKSTISARPEGICFLILHSHFARCDRVRCVTHEDAPLQVCTLGESGNRTQDPSRLHGAEGVCSPTRVDAVAVAVAVAHMLG